MYLPPIRGLLDAMTRIRSERGTSAIEYALMVTGIVAGTLFLMFTFGTLMNVIVGGAMTEDSTHSSSSPAP